MDTLLDFYIRIVGLKLSDRAQDVVAFMHARRQRSSYQLIKSDRPVSCASFEVGNIDEIGMGACRRSTRVIATVGGSGVT
jgi:hypothetical protein